MWQAAPALRPSLPAEPPSLLGIPQIPLSHLHSVSAPWHLPAEEAGKLLAKGWDSGGPPVPPGLRRPLLHPTPPTPTGSLCFAFQLQGWRQRVGQPTLFNPSWADSRVPGCSRLPAPCPSSNRELFLPPGTEFVPQLHPGNQRPSPEPPRWAQADPDWTNRPTVLLALATGSGGDQGTPTGESLGAGTGFIPVGAERLGIRGFLFPNRSPSAGHRVRRGCRRGGGGVENQHV